MSQKSGSDLLEKGFGGIYHVGKASASPPIFACFSHKPPNATTTYAMVGKGIVFDTGGTQIKTKNSMPGMFFAILYYYLSNSSIKWK
ncbi:unnamed protein product [Onchocerca flexuosa]|uniref:CYTOSOL_AP domain-containing protein n=1 Tax=Onchocerca flexuosa TaxID=387005 RepID=A0A183HVW9_9BILA|nr:unnamed protein product [Onchocerca flexuosa]